MNANRCLELHHLRREIMAARDRGRVVIEFADGATCENLFEARQLADEMISLVNLPVLGPHWFEADRARATDILNNVLHWDLETLQASVPEEWARELTKQLLNQFGSDAIYLTNVRPTMDLSKSPHQWASGSDQAEMDAGVAIVSSELVGLLWVEDRP